MSKARQLTAAQLWSLPAVRHLITLAATPLSTTPMHTDNFAA